jgi:hypothetical protein
MTDAERVARYRELFRVVPVHPPPACCVVCGSDEGWLVGNPVLGGAMCEPCRRAIRDALFHG